MKQNISLLGILFVFSVILWPLLHPNYIILAGFGILAITVLFEIKNYRNNKLYFLIGLILAISLILTYIQMSSPLYPGDRLFRLFNYILTIGYTFGIIMAAYDFTHDYKLSKMQINDQPLIRYGVPIIALCIIILFAYQLQILI
jgi:hypothetical protein